MAAYTYMGIANEVLTAFNEVPFATTTEFDNATGFHLRVKEAINDVIAEIYTEGDNEWPFQSTKTTQVLTIGDNTYSAPNGSAKIDWESFYIDRVYGDESSLTSVTADSGAKTFTAAAGSFIDLGFAVGMKVRWGGLTANTTSDYTINTLTATVMTVDEAVTTISTPDTSFTVENSIVFKSSKDLRTIDIDHYRQNYQSAARAAKLTSEYQLPNFVVRESDNNWIIGPSKPNATYLIRYEYFAAFSELSANDDVPTIPSRFKNVIKDGVSREVNRFRDNLELAREDHRKFLQGINNMKQELYPVSTSIRYLS